jgi:hypothetical protein
MNQVRERMYLKTTGSRVLECVPARYTLLNSLCLSSFVAC